MTTPYIGGTEVVRGDITGVTAGTGLTGGATSGDATLSVSFGGNGSATTVSRSDHNHDDRYYDKAYVNALEARIAALEAKLSGLTRSGNDFIITNANLYIQSGSGTTNGAVNGKGNLIIGYNESRGSGDNRTGSHNLIVGPMHNYSNYGGIVGGWRNTISGAYSSVSGGADNTASGYASSVSGGNSNKASSYVSWVSGGFGNIVSGSYSSASGGYLNTASGQYSSVSGGSSNTASGQYSSVSGGLSKTANTDYSLAGSPKPTYDSGWVTINQGQNLTLTHGLGGNPDNYVVDLQFNSNTSGRNQVYYGGVSYYYGYNYSYGAFWLGLTDQTISIARLSDDYVAEQVRVRIWVNN